jgi:aspartate/methionine/tyrosine aminotransferase
MWERTITIGSTGGTLSLTGWQVGWVYGPTKLIHNLMIVHQQSVYTGTTPLQVCTYQFIKNIETNAA